ncbi:DUF4876 domain-containing protein [Ascidiimonas aurantiaca]|uniref:DUF4876 domain-containing protein n=1 Tax=Ascidiimonas aurantiaca TaxID=1685432 RepID=UPI0030EC420D
MRKLVFLVCLVSCFSCSNDDDNFITSISHTLSIRYGSDFENLPAEGAQVTLVNNEDGRSYSGTVNPDGLLTLSLIPGVYNINVSRVFTPEAYQQFFGQSVNQNVTFNASLQNVQINANTSANTSMELVTGLIGNLVLKQIYFAGSDVRLGASLRDQFFEIHNNSNQTLYLDGLYFAQLRGTTRVPSNPREYHLPNGQYDWSQSIGQDAGAASNTDFVYADEVLRIPGSGTQYPLEPGKSMIVAATALNHRAPLVVQDENGETVTFEVPEPNRTIDLSNAPFEGYFRPFQESQGENWLDSDIDNPNSVNVEIAFKSVSSQDLILDAFGRDAFIIFFADDTQFEGWKAVPLPSIGADNFSETTATFLRIPNSVIIDGVETQRDDPSRGKPKRLSDAIDAGEISTIRGAYSSESVRRKIESQSEGRIFYKDTNNSTNDFEVLSIPEVNIP